MDMVDWLLIFVFYQYGLATCSYFISTVILTVLHAMYNNLTAPFIFQRPVTALHFCLPVFYNYYLSDLLLYSA